MKVSFEQVNQMIKTLPIGYYIGREVIVKLDSSAETSMYDINNDIIYISFNQVNSALSKIDDESVDFESLENIVRSLLYHELSHAMITPRSLKVNDMINVFEDERIETILDGYYKGVNFKKCVNLLNEPCDENDQIYFNWFFDLVRLRRGPRYFIEVVDKIINDSSELNSLSRGYYKLHAYISKIESLYNAYKLYLTRNGKSFIDPKESSGENLSVSSSNKEKSPGFESEENLSVSSSNKEKSPGFESEEDSSKKVKKQIVYKEELNFDEEKVHNQKVLSKFKQITNEFVDSHLVSELSRIFTSAQKVQSSRCSAVNSYSGVFDPRSVMRDDYKYFVTRGRGNAQQFTKVHLNLFLDRSMSFEPNEKFANQVISSLIKCEKLSRDFSFTLITCGNGETVESKKNILYEAYDCNNLDSEIWSIFKEVQEVSSVNYNIVLFDGKAAWKPREERNFGAFNNPNTCIISDPSNCTAIETYAPRARCIITTDYTNELKSSIISLLSSVIR